MDPPRACLPDYMVFKTDVRPSQLVHSRLAERDLNLALLDSKSSVLPIKLSAINIVVQVVTGE